LEQSELRLGGGARDKRPILRPKRSRYRLSPAGVCARDKRPAGAAPRAGHTLPAGRRATRWTRLRRAAAPRAGHASGGPTLL